MSDKPEGHSRHRERVTLEIALKDGGTFKGDAFLTLNDVNDDGPILTIQSPEAFSHVYIDEPALDRVKSEMLDAYGTAESRN